MQDTLSPQETQQLKTQAQSLYQQKKYISSALVFMKVWLAKGEVLPELVMALFLSPVNHPKRQSTIATLYQMALPQEVAALIRRMHKVKLLDPAEQNQLRNHFCSLDGPMDDFDRACRVHNISALSKIYSDMSVSSMAQVVGGSKEEAEQTVCKMVEQGQMECELDQVDQWVYFSTSTPKQTQRMQAFCLGLDQCIEGVQAKSI